MAWRSKVNPEIKEKLNLLIEESYQEHEAYKHAKNTANAQLWCALAILAKENESIKKEIEMVKQVLLGMKQKEKYLESTLKELVPQKKQEGKEDPREELKKFLKRL